MNSQPSKHRVLLCITGVMLPLKVPLGAGGHQFHCILLLSMPRCSAEPPRQCWPASTFYLPSELLPYSFCSVKAETSEFTGSLVSPYGGMPWQMHLAPAALIAQGRLCAELNQVTLSGQAARNFFCKEENRVSPNARAMLGLLLLERS